MSDSEEYEYEYDSDEQFDSDEQGSAVDGENDEAAQQRSAARESQIALENTFYEAEDFRQRGDLTQALEYFQRVVALEKEVTPLEERKWSFQALEHAQWEEMLRHYEQMLEHLAFVTRNESTESISSILDVVSSATGKETEKDSAKYTSKMYELTLDKLKDVNNDRLWFSMNVKLGKLYLDMQEFDQLQKLLNQLYDYCQTPDGVQDHSKATSLLEVYALEIQLCVATKNSAKMRIIYPKTLDLDAAVADPRIMGSVFLLMYFVLRVIREEGGKMYLEEKEWMLAYNEFFESFRNYQEAGNSQAKVYQDVEIGAMLLLRGAYEANDIVQFEKTLKNPKYKLLSDPIMKRYLNPLLRNIRCQVMKKLVQLELDAKIDQSRGLLVLQTRQKARDASKMYDALDRWTRALASTHAAIAARVPAHP
ncbi:PCI/PINT associated module [Phytophthora cactorum]|nr:PCI/PINT associated module [Phytophthora cactorum]